VILGRGSTDANCPFQCPIYRQNGGDIHYARGDCPVADDLFDRMISIKLNQWYTEEDCERIARAMNRVFATLCTGTSDGTPWI